MNTRATYSVRKFVANFHSLNLIWKIVLPSRFMVEAYNGDARHEPLPIVYDSTNSNLYLPLSIADFSDAIFCSKVTTLDEDGISAKLFKGLSSHSLHVLLQIYNSVRDAAVVPPDWSSKIILPIIKPGKTKKSTSFYHLIALTFVTCKIFERMISRRTTNHLLHKRRLSNRYLSFLPFRDS